MKRLGLILLLAGLAINVFAKKIDNVQLACDTKLVAKEVGQLIVLPKQTLICAAILTKASGEILGSAGLIRLKSFKLARRGLEKSMLTLLKTTDKACVGAPDILKAQAKLLNITTQLPL